jgi:hypothetical protein
MLSYATTLSYFPTSLKVKAFNDAPSLFAKILR